MAPKKANIYIIYVGLLVKLTIMVLPSLVFTKQQTLRKNKNTVS